MRILSKNEYIYKRYSDKTKYMYFMIKNENCFDKYMTLREKVSNIIKKTFNSKLIDNKKYLKAEKRFKTKESFHCLYMPLILFDSVHSSKGNYYPKMFLEKFYSKFFLEKQRN